MRSNPNHRHQINPSSDCCFLQFFHQNNTQHKSDKRNSNGFLNPYHQLTQISLQPQIPYQKLKLKTQNQAIKRSISSLKLKGRTTNRDHQQSKSIKQDTGEGRSSSKFISTSMDAQVLKRYYSPAAQSNQSINYSQFENKKSILNIKVIQNSQNHTSVQQRCNSNAFYHKQKMPVSLQFRKSTRPNIYPFGTYNSTNHSTNNIQKRFYKLNQQQNMTNIHNPEITLRKKSSPMVFVRISSENNNSLKNVQNQSERQSVYSQNVILNKGELQKIQQTSRQQSRKEGELQEPMNPFEHINSYIVQISKPHEKNDKQEKQFDSIKTKGRPVQSMLYMSKDLTKTKKPRRKGHHRQTQKGLQQLQNITVTSEYQQEQDYEKKQIIEQSAIMMNFFNPPNHVRDKLQLSRSRSGFY